jgi:hypothetical protein
MGILIFLSLCRVPFLQLVESSVELLKDGLEELVERSAECYPHLNLLIKEALFRQVQCMISAV